MANIGVTGHRILCDLDRIQKSIDEALIRLSTKFSGEPLTLFTSLAEGTDRFVAQQFRNLKGPRMVAVLPLVPSEYLEDFTSDESKNEFAALLDAVDEVIQIPPFADRDAAYEAAGLYIVDHCDAMICIWDGREAQGRGGTGFMMERARNRGIPITWIRAGNRRPGTIEPTSLGDEQGKITYENF